MELLQGIEMENIHAFENNGRWVVDLDGWEYQFAIAKSAAEAIELALKAHAR